MNTMKLAIAAAAIVALSGAAAVAQDSTTTTTTTHQTESAPAPGVTVGVPGVVGVQVGGGSVEHGCTTKSKTTTDEDTGDSASVTKSNC